MVLSAFMIFGHSLMTFSGLHVGVNLGRSLSGGYLMRLAGMGIVDPVDTAISQRCFYRSYFATGMILKSGRRICLEVAQSCPPVSDGERLWPPSEDDGGPPVPRAMGYALYRHCGTATCQPQTGVPRRVYELLLEVHHPRSL